MTVISEDNKLFCEFFLRVSRKSTTKTIAATNHAMHRIFANIIQCNQIDELSGDMFDSSFALETLAWKNEVIKMRYRISFLILLLPVHKLPV